jgi:hypothetical protein
MDICSLRNIKKLTKKWEQWEQEKINQWNQFIKPIEESNKEEKPRTKWEQKPRTTHTIEEEELIQSYLDFVNQCLPGDEWQIPTDWLTETDSLRDAADLEVRKRNPKFRVWRSGENHLACKIFFGKEPPPYRRPPSSNRFRKSSTNRIETMWSEEHGWCRWDSTKQDYIPDSELNP